MPMHDTDSLIVEADGAAESLPDPVAVPGRTHVLVNTGAAAATWSSAGATPFLELGAPVATVSIPRGQVKRVQSDGARWVVMAETGRRITAATGVTDAAGNVTVAFAPPFPAAPVVTHAVQTGIADVTECRVSALSAASVTFNVRRSPAVVVLGISVLQVPVPAAGVTVHCVATAAAAV